MIAKQSRSSMTVGKGDSQTPVGFLGAIMRLDGDLLW